MKNIKICPICGLQVTNKYYAFPKLPAECKFASIYDLTHINCLRFHPEKKEIQDELTKVYLQIFKNHPTFPILAQEGYILIKYHLDDQQLEIYNFEDFVDFYLCSLRRPTAMPMG